LIFGFAEDLLGYSNADACRFGQLSERSYALFQKNGKNSFSVSSGQGRAAFEYQAKS
jgi:hypothetical protein